MRPRLGLNNPLEWDVMMLLVPLLLLQLQDRDHVVYGNGFMNTAEVLLVMTIALTYEMI